MEESSEPPELDMDTLAQSVIHMARPDYVLFPSDDPFDESPEPGQARAIPF